MASTTGGAKRRAEDGGGRSDDRKRNKEGRGDDRDRQGGRGKGKGKYRGWPARPAPTLEGPGIFASCTRGKERKAAFELIDVLEEIVERLYPGLVLEASDVGRIASTSAARLSVDDDDLDAMRNGEAFASDAKTETRQAGAGLKSEGANNIEDQIAAELAELQGGKGSGTTQAPRRKPFAPVFLDIECVVFIKVAQAIDPHKITYALLDEVRQTGLVRSHHVHKLTPVYDSTRAELPSIVDMAARIFADKIDEKAQTYKIDTRIRFAKVAKMDLIQSLASRLTEMTRGASTVAADGNGTTSDLARLRVNLSNPDCVLHVEVYKNTAWVGMLHSVETYCKLNPHSIAEKRNGEAVTSAEMS